jgi:hypothetical protein
VRNYQVNTEGIRSPLSVVNVDDDPKPEIIHGTDLHHIVVWHISGTPEAGCPIVVRESVRGKVTIADLDNLGKLEVVASDLAGVIHVWDYRDQMGTGIPATPMTPVRDYLGLNRPNPFNPRTVIPFDVSRQEKVSLRVYSVAGRLLLELEGGVRDAGHYEAVWDARDAEGHAVPSGVYLSELRIDGRQVGGRKLLLL